MNAYLSHSRRVFGRILGKITTVSLLLICLRSTKAQWAVSYEDFNTSGSPGSGSGTHTGNGSSSWVISSLSFSSSTGSTQLVAGMSFEGHASAHTDLIGGNAIGTAFASAGASTLAWGEWDWTGGGTPDTLNGRLIISITGSMGCSGSQTGTSGTSSTSAISSCGVNWDFTAQSNTPWGSNGLSGSATGHNGASGQSDLDLVEDASFSFDDPDVSFSATGTTSQYHIDSDTGEAGFTLSYDENYPSEYGSTQYWTQLHLSFSAFAQVSGSGAGAGTAGAFASGSMSGSMTLNLN